MSGMSVSRDYQGLSMVLKLTTADGGPRFTAYWSRTRSDIGNVSYETTLIQWDEDGELWCAETSADVEKDGTLRWKTASRIRRDGVRLPGAWTKDIDGELRPWSRAYYGPLFEWFRKREVEYSGSAQKLTKEIKVLTTSLPESVREIFRLSPADLAAVALPPKPTKRFGVEIFDTGPAKPPTKEGDVGLEDDGVTEYVFHARPTVPGGPVVRDPPPPPHPVCDRCGARPATCVAVHADVAPDAACDACCGHAHPGSTDPSSDTYPGDCFKIADGGHAPNELMQRMRTRFENRCIILVRRVALLGLLGDDVARRRARIVMGGPQEVMTTGDCERHHEDETVFEAKWFFSDPTYAAPEAICNRCNEIVGGRGVRIGGPENAAMFERRAAKMERDLACWMISEWSSKPHTCGSTAEHDVMDESGAGLTPETCLTCAAIVALHRD